MHDWEVPIIAASAVLLAAGWGLHFLSMKLDCHDTGCHHGACSPRKSKTSKLLWIATGLFAANLAIYGFFHFNKPLPHTAVQPQAAHHDTHAH